MATGSYRGRFFVRSRIWHCGKHVEMEAYPVFQPPGQRRSRCRPTRECQKRINQRDAERKAQRLLLANFGENGLEIDLTFAKPATEEEAREQLRKYLRKLRTIYRNAGEDLRYLYTMEQGKRSRRTHFHLTLNAGPLSRDDLEKLWPHGYANSRRLVLDESGLAGLSKYITKQGRKRPQEEMGRRRWSCSKNLIRPEPEIRDGAVTVAALEAMADAVDRRQAEDVMRERFPGMDLVEAVAVRNAVNGGLYLSFFLAAREMWRSWPPMASYSSVESGAEAAP